MENKTKNVGREKVETSFDGWNISKGCFGCLLDWSQLSGRHVFLRSVCVTEDMHIWHKLGSGLKAAWLGVMSSVHVFKRPKIKPELSLSVHGQLFPRDPMDTTIPGCSYPLHHTA